MKLCVVAGLIGLWLIVLPCSASANERLQKALEPQMHQRPIVVELFTSQGCSSCPPADAFISELVGRPDILPLSLHVPYWDYVGWQDPFALKQNEKRQRIYNKGFGLNRLYTPQVVVDGITHFVGTEREKIMAKVEDAKFNAPSIPITFKHDLEEEKLIVKVAGVDDGLDLHAFPERSDIWMMGLSKGFTTPVTEGENTGRKLTNHHIVRQLNRIDVWNKRTEFYPIDLSNNRYDGVAILVQEEGQGRILGAALHWLTR